jgi:alpha-tubulin suppressor-like RCC1 family protein
MSDRLAADGPVSCALIDSTLCWGAIAALAPGLDSPTGLPLEIPDSHFATIAASQFVLCGLDLECTPRCGGRTVDYTSPARALARIEGVERARRVGAGWLVGCALTSEQGWVSWGAGRQAWARDAQRRAGARVLEPAPPWFQRPEPLRADAEVFDCRSGCLLAGGAAACTAMTWPSGGDDVFSALPVPEPLVAIEGTYTYGCAITRAGRVWCWGRVPRDGLSDAIEQPRAVAVDCARDLAIGRRFRCALRCDGTVVCWGANEHGQLGRGHTRDEPQVGAVPALVGVEEIAAGGEHACARTSEGVSCWGSRRYGELGDGVVPAPSPPHAIDALRGASDVRISRDAICDIGSETPRCVGVAGDALASRMGVSGSGVAFDATSYCVAAGERVRCGYRDGTPEDVAIGARSVGVGELGADWVCGLGADGELGCAQRTEQGRWATGRVAEGIVAFDLGMFHGCALRSDGGVRCFSRDPSRCREASTADDSLCRPDASRALLDASSVRSAAEIAVGGGHACARDSAGAVYCWGVSTHQQIPGVLGPSAPVRVALPGAAISIAADELSSCAVLRDGTVVCWGDGSDVRLGCERTDRAPLPVPGLANAERVWAGPSGYCARLATRDLVCWGWAGAIDRLLSASPVAVTGLPR